MDKIDVYYKIVIENQKKILSMEMK